MINPFTYGSRSQAHARCVGQVKSHLKKICTSADKEMGLIPFRITDAWGYSSKKKVFYLCEIKVQHKDLHKSIAQISDTARRFKLNPDYIRLGGNVFPIIAISNGLSREETSYYSQEWESFRETCKRLKISIWIVEQSSIRYLQGHNPILQRKLADKSGSKPANTLKTTKKPLAKTIAKPKIVKTEKAKPASKLKATAKGKKPKLLAKPKYGKNGLSPPKKKIL